MWSLLEIILKLCFYLSFVTVIGAIAARTLSDEPNYKQWLVKVTRLAALLGGGTVITHFFIAVGSFNEDGFGGMFDGEMALMLWQSSVGDSVLLRGLGFGLLVLMSVLLASKKLSMVVGLAGAVLIASSFMLVGHTSELSWLARVAIVAHVLALSLWAGTLLPLLRMRHCLSPAQCHQAMMRYGEQAIFVIAILLISGVLLVTQLVDFEQDLSNNYNLLLLIKVSLVIAMLGLGARNKLRLVPQLITSANNAKHRLSRAISIEACLALVILSLSAVFTTILGPS